MSVFLLVAFFGLSMLGVPLAIALALASVGTLWLFTSMPMDLLSQTMFSSMNSFLLVAVPLFILVGTVMERGRVAERIFDFAEAMVGWLPGGLGHVNVISSVIFPVSPARPSPTSPLSAPSRSRRWSGMASRRVMPSA